ncbi:hypothetical protein KP509_22G015200 [Ceratopteris richardii]|uniref:Secreted protein n=1 Tax=Ceratopteris richardii TaxID=49495 RepID=A0A8T2S5H7_CERRI|nr:hypothetical protein KP509_22G015200 [Ceratopteris richardii]
MNKDSRILCSFLVPLLCASPFRKNDWVVAVLDLENTIDFLTRIYVKGAWKIFSSDLYTSVRSCMVCSHCYYDSLYAHMIQLLCHIRSFNIATELVILHYRGMTRSTRHGRMEKNAPNDDIGHAEKGGADGIQCAMWRNVWSALKI